MNNIIKSDILPNHTKLLSAKHLPQNKTENLTKKIYYNLLQ